MDVEDFQIIVDIFSFIESILIENILEKKSLLLYLWHGDSL